MEAEESSSASQKGTRRTASLPAWAMRSAHCPLRLGHCPLRQRIVRMPHHTPSVWLVSRKKRATLLPAARPALLLSAFCALRAALTLRSQLCFALSAPLCALSAALSISYQPLALALSSDDDPPLSARS